MGCDDGLKASGETGVKNTESELNIWSGTERRVAVGRSRYPRIRNHCGDFVGTLHKIWVSLASDHIPAHKALRTLRRQALAHTEDYQVISVKCSCP